MTFQAYIDAVTLKTGKTPAQLKTEAAQLGVYSADMKATALVAWLAEKHGLGRGHAMAVWAVWKAQGWVQAPK